MMGPDYFLLIGLLGLFLVYTIDSNPENPLIQTYKITDFSREIFDSSIIMVVLAIIYSITAKGYYDRYWGMVDALRKYGERNS